MRDGYSLMYQTAIPGPPNADRVTSINALKGTVVSGEYTFYNGYLSQFCCLYLSSQTEHTLLLHFHKAGGLTRDIFLEKNGQNQSSKG